MGIDAAGLDGELLISTELLGIISLKVGAGLLCRAIERSLCSTELIDKGNEVWGLLLDAVEGMFSDGVSLLLLRQTIPTCDERVVLTGISAAIAI